MEKRRCRSSARRGLIGNIKEYLMIQLDLIKLDLVEKSSQIIAFMVALIIGSLLLLTTFLVLVAVFVYWMNTIFGSMIPGLLMVAGLLILLFILFLVFKDRILLNPIIRKFSKILFDKDKLNDDE